MKSYGIEVTRTDEFWEYTCVCGAYLHGTSPDDQAVRNDIMAHRQRQSHERAMAQRERVDA